MAYTPISGQPMPYPKNAGGASASGYYLKGYEAGTNTPLSMATDDTGGTTLDKCLLNTLGYPLSNPADDNTVFIPHFNESYKLVLYPTEADADGNITANASWVVDNISGQFDASQLNYTATTTVEQKLNNLDAASYIELKAITITQLANNDSINVRYRTSENDGGGGPFHWDSSNNAANVTSDPGEGIYVPPDSDPTGVSGCWVRQDATSESVDARWFGAVGDASTDDTTAVQNAINYCLSFEGSPVNGQDLIPILDISGMCRLTASLKIDHIEGASSFFRIRAKGVVGGFVCTTSITMIDTDIAAPAWSNKVSFEDLTFSTSISTSHVINYTRFARVNFTRCFFDHIRLLTQPANPTTYVISLRLSECFARIITGKFIDAKDAYDTHLENCLFEQVTDTVFYSLDGFAGCAVTNCLIQSNSGKCIETPGIAQGLAVNGNYFENNVGEVLDIGRAAGVTFLGNYVNTRQNSPDNRADATFFEVVVNESQGFVGSGNKFSTRGYSLPAMSDFVATVGAGDDAGVELVRAADQTNLRDIRHGNVIVKGFNDSGAGCSFQLQNTGTSINTTSSLKFLHSTSIKNEITSTIFGGSGFGRFVFNGRGGSGPGATYATLDYQKLELASGCALSFSGATITPGTGSPEGVLTANVGSLFLRTDGGAGTSMYVKESGTGNTGWVAK